MNKDIQAFIEREAEKQCNNNLTVVTLHDKMEIFEHGASFALSLFKWRKVE